jgi:iron complex outermembrane receptor protein
MKNLTKLKSLFVAVFLLLGTSLMAQTISGTISSEDGPLPGATIIVKGTNNGTTSDFDGNFSIDASSSDVLVISFVGFVSQEVSVGDNDQLTVSLVSDTELEEIVVTGYGSQREKEISSAVTKITAEEFNKGPISSAAGLLEGAVAGLSIYSKGGNPNAGSTIRLRGISTLGGNVSPLFVIDGIPGASIDNLDPQDIETINVLKDGSAAAIYGSQGSSGVIIVTTKKGTPGKMRISYSGEYSVAEKMNAIQMLTPQEFRDFGGADLGASNNWVDQVTRQGITQNNSISATGGFDKTTFRVAINTRDVEGVVKATGFTSFNTRTSMQTKAFNDKLSINMNASYTRRKSDLGNSAVLEFANIFNPTAPVYFKDAPTEIQNYFTTEQITKSGGYFQTLGLFRSFNPVAIQEQGIYAQDRNEFAYNVGLDYALSSNLKVFATASKNRSSAENRTSRSVYDYNTQANLGDRAGRVDYGDYENESATYEVYGTLNSSLGSGIDMVLTGGYSYIESDYFQKTINVGDFPDEAIDYSYSLGSSEDLLNAGLLGLGSYKAPTNKTIAGFGRVNLTIDNAIFINASVRREGSNKLGEENKWGVFPGGGIAVDLNKYVGTAFEKFKVRVGVGVTGALPSGSGLSQLVYNFSNSDQATTQARAANPDLKWEEKTETNFGVEFRNGPLDLTVDYYTRDITDFIFDTEVDAAVYGFNRRFENVGDIESSGFELSASYQVNDIWTPTINLSQNKSTLKTYTTEDGITTGNLGSPGQNATNMVLVKAGYQIGTIWGPVYDGVDAATGKPQFKDLNGDGQVIAGQDKALDPQGDFQELGQGYPDLELGFRNVINLGKFQINAYFQGAFGHSLVNTWRAFFEPRIGSQFAYNFVNTKYADNDLKAAAFSSLYVEKADFFKLANLTVAYDLDLPINGISSTVVSLNVRNAFVITNYTGADPTPSIVDGGYDAGGGSLSGSGNILAPGIDRRNNYFDSRTFTLGLNINF